MIRHLIFDLDGTLTDTLVDLHRSVNHALCQCSMPERSIAEVRQYVGNGVHKLVERAVPEHTSTEEVERCFNYFRAHYVQHCQDNSGPYPGIQQMLAELHARDYRMAIVSNKLQAGVDELHRTYFADTIEVAIGEREGLRRKPAPDMVLLAMQTMGADDSNSLYIGDSEVDVATARAAGLPCLSVLWGFRDRPCLIEAGATHFISHPDELLDALQSIEG